MKKIPKISDAEYEIMKVIWENEPLTAADIVSIVDSESWNENTIRTMVNRLLKKAAIGYKKNGKAYIYHSLISSGEYKKFEGMSFLKKIYGGSISAMFANLVNGEEISKDELNDLKELLEKELGNE
ncbi:BlaI family transcriptional regulator, penicillinase repressor [Peptoclostridium litorale DSM 5388]|uniref:Penicillinase repressor n=1 Tax=Peptoclostridium litorale DSM 5388 TaxID=1121324 RepID=A0A069RFD6_PEPLI|nr:BlaI/MecI/CopY family transcriptional regulator [Peptoclostridium litorale]KDR95503.1 penicillinase repressor [Peptoclostridium litorale DSM 5388]SIO17295.1 BlaI family transcriptional regulator, penicillinase repressor [Peptoclostridium litorale DSM 5388]